MSSIQGEVYRAFRTINVPEKEAMDAAEALSRRDEDVSAIKGELLLHRWMLGVNTALLLAVFVKLFVHG